MILLLPVLIGSATVELKTLTDKVFGSFLAGQSISYLNYAAKIYSLPGGILVLALLTVLYPTMVELYYQRKMQEFKETVCQGTGLMIMLMFPIMVGMMVLRTPIVRLIYERAALTPRQRATRLMPLFFTAWAFAWGHAFVQPGLYSTKTRKRPCISLFLPHCLMCS